MPFQQTVQCGCEPPYTFIDDWAISHTTVGFHKTKWVEAIPAWLYPAMADETRDALTDCCRCLEKEKLGTEAHIPLG
jgi:hypothetical protein